MIENSKELKINLNYNNYLGYTPFFRACGNGGNVETVKVLMESAKEYNIDLNKRGRERQTAFLHLMLQAPRDHLKICRLFLEKYKELDIDLKAVDIWDRSAVDLVLIRIDGFRSDAEMHEAWGYNVILYKDKINEMETVIDLLKEEYSKMNL